MKPMSKGDRVWLLGRRYLCRGTHPDGDSIALDTGDGNLIKADEDEFRLVKPSIWAWTPKDARIAEAHYCLVSIKPQGWMDFCPACGETAREDRQQPGLFYCPSCSEEWGTLERWVSLYVP